MTKLFHAMIHVAAISLLALCACGQATGTGASIVEEDAQQEAPQFETAGLAGAYSTDELDFAIRGIELVADDDDPSLYTYEAVALGGYRCAGTGVREDETTYRLDPCETVETAADEPAAIEDPPTESDHLAWVTDGLTVMDNQDGTVTVAAAGDEATFGQVDATGGLGDVIAAVLREAAPKPKGASTSPEDDFLPKPKGQTLIREVMAVSNGAKRERVTTFAYDEQGRIANVSQVGGYTTTVDISVDYAYDDQGRLVRGASWYSIPFEIGELDAYEYGRKDDTFDKRGRVIESTHYDRDSDKTTSKTTYEYGKDGKVHETCVTYFGDDGEPVMTDRTESECDDQGRLMLQRSYKSTRTEAESLYRTTTYKWDEQGRLLRKEFTGRSFTDTPDEPEDHGQTTYTYNDDGTLASYAYAEDSNEYAAWVVNLNYRDGRVSQCYKSEPADSSYVRAHAYTYDDEGRLIAWFTNRGHLEISTNGTIEY